MNAYVSFYAYRYQLLPLDRNETKDLYHDRSIQEIIAQKNELFSVALTQLREASKKTTSISLDVLKDDFFKIHLAPSRPLTRETFDARRERIENWPHVDAYVLNHPEDQILLIQSRIEAYANTDMVANIFLRGTRQSLEKVGLSLQIEPLFKESHFWGLIQEYSNKVTSVEFEFVTPNMANISNTLEDTLKNLAKKTNAVREHLTLRADPNSSLDISQDNQIIQGLVTYSSKGAGDIKLKIKGMRKRVQTSSAKREVSLSGIELTAPPEALLQIIRGLLK